MHRRLPFSSALPCKAGNNLAQPMKVGTFNRTLVEALSNWLLCCAAVHQCARMSVPVCPHGRSSNQDFSTQAARCVAKKLMTSQFPSLLNDHLEFGKSCKRLVGVLMIATDLLQNGAQDGMFRHPIRDALDSAAIIQWFPYDNTHCHVVTWYGPLTKIVSHMGVAVKIACFRHGHVDERSVNSG